MVPMWTRAQRLANAYAYAILDILFAIFWFSAFIAVATWNTAGIRQGVVDKKMDSNSGNCSTFAYGSASICNLSKTSVGFGFIVLWVRRFSLTRKTQLTPDPSLLFVITASISTYAAIQYHRTGSLPGSLSAYIQPTADLEAQNKDAWSTDVHDFGHDYDGHDNDVHADSTRSGVDDYAPLHTTDTHYGRHPGRPVSFGLERNDLSGGEYDGRPEPSALSPAVDHGHVAFPHADYGYASVTGR
ncbi:hypothetical protein LTR50_001377 [Elasticomyces elasticus]|nr:hypothetical protein LTR50_001377 [Elasticomyces elasticus]